MDYEKFHQAVVLAYINHGGDPIRFFDEVVAALNQFREEKQAAQQGVRRTGLCPECGAPGYDKIVCEQCGFPHQPRP